MGTALPQSLFETEFAEEFLENNHSSEGGQLLVLETDLGNRTCPRINLISGNSHFEWPFVVVTVAYFNSTLAQQEATFQLKHTNIPHFFKQLESELR